MAGSPSQFELFDYKPERRKLDGEDCPPEFLEGKRFAFISGVPKMLGPNFEFNRHGLCSAWDLPNPKGISRSLRRRALDSINDIKREAYEETGDPETPTSSDAGC